MLCSWLGCCKIRELRTLGDLELKLASQFLMQLTLKWKLESEEVLTSAKERVGFSVEEQTIN